jgi:hypothetical protein
MEAYLDESQRLINFIKAKLSELESLDVWGPAPRIDAPRIEAMTTSSGSVADLSVASPAASVCCPPFVTLPLFTPVVIPLAVVLGNVFGASTESGSDLGDTSVDRMLESSVKSSTAAHYNRAWDK